MKLIVTYEWEDERGRQKESLKVDLTQNDFDLGDFNDTLEIVEVQKNHVLLNIKDGVGQNLGEFRQYVFQYCPVTIETELEGEYSSLRLELVV